ncbi:MAG: hypothetical protein ACTHN0_14780 [Aquihabitans sp.]
MPTARLTGALVFGLVLALASCGGGSSDGSSTSASSSPTAAPTASSTSTTEAESESGGGSSSEERCTKLNDAAAQLELVPLFLQLNTPDNVIAVRGKLLGDLDLDEFFRAMVTLHQLDGSTSPLGDPSAAIDVYERAAVNARPLFETPRPDQADINTYQDSLGDPGAFLSYQTPIAAAISEAGC